MSFKGASLTILLVTCVVMVSSMPTEISQKNRRQDGILGNPAKVFTGLFKDLSKVAIGKIEKIKSIDERFPVPMSLPTVDDIKSYKFKRREIDSESDESDINDDDSDDNDSDSYAGEVETPEQEEETDSNIQKKSDEEVSLESLDEKLKELELKIKDGLNETFFEKEEEYQIAKERFANEFKELKADFLENMEDVATGLFEFRDKFLGEVEVEKKSNEGCYHGEGCLYDLDALDEMTDIDARIQSFDDTIKKTLSLPIFDHHRFQRTKIQFTKQFKDTKEIFLNRMHKIASFVKTFAQKASSSNQEDKKFVNRKEEGLLYRNDQSLF